MKALIKKIAQWAWRPAARPVPLLTAKNVYSWRYGSIHYTARGEGEPVLLVHGTTSGQSADSWQGLTHRLSKKYRVYALDLLGFGRSDVPAVSYSAYLYATLIRDFIDHVIQQDTIVVARGQSAAFAVKACVIAPARVKKLICLNPARRVSQGKPPKIGKLLTWRLPKRVARYVLATGGVDLNAANIKHDLQSMAAHVQVVRGGAQGCLQHL